MARYNMNPNLSKGDRVICISMDDAYSAVPTGMAGVVTHESEVFGTKQYNVNWDNGSRLALIDGADKWIKEEDMLNRRRKKTEESYYITKKNFLNEDFYQSNTELFRNFNVKMLQSYLKKLRESGVTNMMAKILEKQNKEVTPRSVSRQVEQYAGKMVMAYTKLIGGRL